MAVAVDAKKAGEVEAALAEAGETVIPIGKIVANPGGEPAVILKELETVWPS